MKKILNLPFPDMIRFPILFLFLILCSPVTSYGQTTYEKDVIQTSAGDVEIVFFGHGSLMMTHAGKNIYIDPFNREANYATMQKADLILLTHEHGDHFDPEAIALLLKENTEVVCTEKCALTYTQGIVMHNGDTRTFSGYKIEAVPAYNLVHGPSAGKVFHPKGEGNGYIITIGDKRIFIAGDTENTPEMKALKHIDVAFLPMNLPYTMTPEMVADAVTEFKPAILYPYHYGDTDTQILIDLLKNQKETEIRIRKMK
jgi:L-ascorbate metabolism protein UlaG (beta-lactamase superfamily)